MTFPAEGVCVNGITCCLALGELTLQVSHTHLVLDKTLPKRALATPKTPSRCLSLLSETNQTVVAAFGGSAGLLSTM
jgi:hypothetical protein